MVDGDTTADDQGACGDDQQRGFGRGAGGHGRGEWCGGPGRSGDSTGPRRRTPARCDCGAGGRCRAARAGRRCSGKRRCGQDRGQRRHMEEGSQTERRQAPALDCLATVRALPGVVCNPATFPLGEAATDRGHGRPPSEVAAPVRLACDQGAIGATEGLTRAEEQRLGGTARDAQHGGDLLVA